MNRPGDEFLARAGLAENEHGGINPGNLINLSQHVEQRGLLPTISPKLCSLRISSWRSVFCASSRAFSCSIRTRSVMSTNIVRVNLPPMSGLDHH